MKILTYAVSGSTGGSLSPVTSLALNSLTGAPLSGLQESLSNAYSSLQQYAGKLFSFPFFFFFFFCPLRLPSSPRPLYRRSFEHLVTDCVGLSAWGRVCVGPCVHARRSGRLLFLIAFVCECNNLGVTIPLMN
jgi:hypothetical protein